MIGTFLRGLTVVLPGALTVWLLVWLVSGMETLLRQAFVLVLPQSLYFPGLGILLSLILIYAIGLLMKVFVVRRLWDWFETLLSRIPLVKTIYLAARDFFGFFSSSSAEDASTVASIDLGNDTHLIGFITDEKPTMFDEIDQGLIAMYVPMSYQVGGFTLLVPKSRVKVLGIPREEAMRFVLTAGIKRQ